MGNIKYLTVFDDEYNVILNRTRMSKRKLAYLPAYYRIGEHSHLDGISATGRDFINFLKSDSVIEDFGISSSVFQYVYEQISLRGYKSLFIVLPHTKWYDYSKSAILARKNMYRNAVNNNEKDLMSVYVFNSKGLGIAPILLADKLATMYAECAMPLDLLNLYAEKYAESSSTYILTRGINVFNNTEDLKAFRITSTRVFPVELHGDDDTKIESFAKRVSAEIKKREGRFAVSYGPDCNFAGDVTGKLHYCHSLHPVVDAQYAAPSLKILGSKSLCIHLGDYI